MKVNVLLFAYLCVACVHCENSNSGENKVNIDNPMIELTDSNFIETIESNNYFVMFYAPWCRHSRNLLPKWNQLAKIYNVQGNGTVKIASANCDNTVDACNDNNIAYVPTLKLFKLNSTEPIEYEDDDRGLPAFTKFINDQISSSPEKK